MRVAGDGTGGVVASPGGVTFGPGALDRLMPLHLLIAPNGQILNAGPTLLRLASGDGAIGPLAGQVFLDRFELLVPSGARSVADMAAEGSGQVKLRLRGGPDFALRGLAVPVAEGGLLINLSFGISLVDAVRRFGLTKDDFASTDLAIELLYVIEAKSAVLAESARLTDRLRAAGAAAEREAFTDALTGLANRRALDGVLDEVIAEGRDFSLMRIDLDYFKEVNDRLGHAAGDHVLAVVAGRLRRAVRASDIVARVGGDEFVVVLRDRLGADGLDAAASRIIARISRPIPFEGETCRVSASIGTTLSTLYAVPEVDVMLRDADAALYLSKREGRARATRVTAAALASGAFAGVLGGGDTGEGQPRPAASHKA
jgi:diguanylate cyclase (GGDEF)-like protein